MERSLVFTKNKNPMLDLPIRAFEGGTASHVGCRVGDQVIDTSLSQGGVRLHEWERWQHKYELVCEVPVTFDPELAGQADQWLYAQIGKPYDWTAIVGFALMRDWSEEDWWFCSEIGASWCLQGGWRFASRYSRLGVRLLLEVAYARARALGHELR